jgi:AmmeMemoRadiSam system protein B
LFDPSVQLVPIMVGDVRGASLQHCAAALAPFLADPQNFFVISSDFCHWCTPRLAPAHAATVFCRLALTAMQGRSLRLHSR